MSDDIHFAALGRELVTLLTDRGLGAIPKRDLDALLLYLLEKHLGWATLSNQQLSLRMRLPVPKIKSLRYEGALRYTEDLDSEFRTRLRRVLRQAAFSADNDRVEFIVEDYATRFVLEEYLKKRGKIAQWTFNDEGLAAPAKTIGAIIADQFNAKERSDALARLKISDPDTLSAEVEDAFVELVEAAKSSKVAKLSSVAVKAVGLGKQAKALAAIIFA